MGKIKTLLPQTIPGIIRTIKSLPGAIGLMVHFALFFMLLLIFMTGKFFQILKKIPLLGWVVSRIDKRIGQKTGRITALLSEKIEGRRSSELRRSYLINMAYRSMMLKRTRSIITILGMSVGIGIIVFLLSLGYGIEKLIIGRVASLQELKIVDVSTGQSASLRLNREAYNKIAKDKAVDKIVPFTSIVGRVTFNKANTDVVVYAAPQDYFKLVQLKLLQGKVFSDNSRFLTSAEPAGLVAGASDALFPASKGGAVSGKPVMFNIKPETAATVWSDCDLDQKILGKTKRVEGGFTGMQIWGEDYAPFIPYGRAGYDRDKNIYFGRWIKAKFPLYDQDAEGNLQPLLDEYGGVAWENGCIKQEDAGGIGGQVLGESTDVLAEASGGALLADNPEASGAAMLSYDAVTVATDEAGMELVQLQASASAKQKTVETLKFSQKPSGEAVVSSAMLNLLNIPLNKAIGSEFRVTFNIAKNLMPDVTGKVMSSETAYRILGVIDDQESPYFYIPMADLQKLNVRNFSQLKISVKDRSQLTTLRKSIETMGFRTASTIDTVQQIESLFANVRILLALLGMVALGVASLGMFNTLTVSLLERTREIGGMKTMGMVSDEVQDLFLAEAMIMGLSGGVGGLMIGFLTGKTLSVLISILAISRGQMYMDLTYIPPFLTFFIVVCSFIVGLVTGLYPAQRAKKISALNALRYE